MKVYANKHEAQGLQRVTGISDSDIVKVESGDALKVGNVEIEFLHTPGHTPGLAVLPGAKRAGVG